MRSLWKGWISFGLVTIPVRLYAAAEDRRVAFHLLHRRCHSRIRYQRFCPACRTEVGEEELVRAVEWAPGQYVEVTEEDLERLPLPTLHTFEIQDFVAMPEVDPIFFEKSYYVEPAEGGERAYALLREAMQRTGTAALGRIALRQREALACLRLLGPEGRVLVLATMHYADEIRPPEALPALRAPVPVDPRQLELAVELIGRLRSPFLPERYRDRYREALQQLIEAKVRGREVRVPPPPEPPVVDLLEALRASLEQLEAAADGRPRPAP